MIGCHVDIVRILGEDGFRRPHVIRIGVGPENYVDQVELMPAIGGGYGENIRILVCAPLLVVLRV
jgi:hypothetical protein